MNELYLILIALIVSISAFFGCCIAYDSGRIQGCQIAMRDLYKDAGIKVINGDSLLKYCQDKTK